MYVMNEADLMFLKQEIVSLINEENVLGMKIESLLNMQRNDLKTQLDTAENELFLLGKNQQDNENTLSVSSCDLEEAEIAKLEFELESFKAVVSTLCRLQLEEEKEKTRKEKEEIEEKEKKDKIAKDKISEAEKRAAMNIPRGFQGSMRRLRR